MSKWISVNCAKELPVGSWLVNVSDKRTGEVTRHIAVRKNNVTLVGGHFHFDMDPVVSYYNLDVYEL